MQKLTVSPVATSEITKLPGAWVKEDYKKLIGQLDGELEGIAEDEILDYLFLLLTDLPLNESAYEILKYRLGDQLSEGQLQNLSHEMEEDKMWEEYPDMAFHKEIFIVNQLLYAAYNGKVPKGEAIKIELNIKSKDTELMELVKSKDADVILRIIMEGSDDHAIIHRLFDDSEDGYLKDAEHIIWHFEILNESKFEINISVISSSYWFQSFSDEEPFEVKIDIDIYSDIK